MSSFELVAIQTFPNRIDAELAQSALEAAGIESTLRADDAGGLRPALAFSAGISVLVRVKDAAAAKDVLAGPPRRRQK